MKKYLDRAVFDELFSYDPETGDLFWKPRKVMSKYEKIWNTRHAGRKINHLDNNGYYSVVFNKVRYRVHSIIMVLLGETFEPGDEVDHINHNRTDNRPGNLRKVTRTKNSRNDGMRSDNTSGVTGVYWHKEGKKWCAKAVTVDGKNKHLGLFSKIDDAVTALKAFREENGYHPNHGNPK